MYKCLGGCGRLVSDEEDFCPSCEARDAELIQQVLEFEEKVRKVKHVVKVF